MPSSQRQIVEQAKCTYSPLRRAFKKQTKTIEEQGGKQTKPTEDQGEKQIKALENKFERKILDIDQRSIAFLPSINFLNLVTHE